MHPAFQLLLCFLLFMLIHISVMALCARAFGITLRQISYGVGPTLLSLGKVHVKLLPLAGNVVLKDTREETLYDDDPCLDAYNFQPLWKQVAAAAERRGRLAGLVAGHHGSARAGTLRRCLRANHPRRAGAVVDGAGHCWVTGKRLRARTALRWCSPCSALKLCAFNLLPFAGLNGGQALLAIARGGKPYVAWEESATKWLLLPGLAILLAWVVAFGWYAWKAMAA